ncbi:MAG TPA: CpXC domain-containing protein [Myxococcota bacterium]|nr:CpXC domain-containing protein [Myxococcota bacterium]
MGIIATSRRSVRITCDCGGSFAAAVVRVINLATDPDLVDSLLAGSLNRVCCKHCGREFPSETPVYIHDRDRMNYVCLFPSAWRSRELALRIEFYQELLGMGGDAVPAYVREAKFVFDTRPCAELLGRPGPLAGPGQPLPIETLPEEPAESRICELEESDFEQVSDVERVDRRDSVLMQRWVESGQDYYAFLDAGAFHIFQRHPAPERFGDKADVFFQLHRIENFPLVVLLLVAESTAGGNEVLYWIFNLDNRIDVKFIEQLAGRFEVNLHLFDLSYKRRRSMVFSPPLSSNVEYVLAEARKWLEQIDPKRRNFFIAAGKFDETAYEKLGRSRAGLQVEAFRDLPSPSLTKLALDILTYWSSRDNYEYLIFIKSFPVANFKSILENVLKRAIYFGLDMTEKMKRLAVELGLAASKEDLVGCLVGNFAEVLLGLRDNDLDPVASMENWRMLSESAAELGVEIDPRIIELARSSAKNFDEASGDIPIDLSDDVEMLSALDQLETPELVDLLKDPENRAEAARVLSETGRPEMFADVAQAYRHMSRSEIDSLGDALAGFGDSARKFILEIIHTGRGAQLSGALRALVKLDGQAAIPELVKVVASGKRGVWREAVGLIGVLQGPADEVVELSKIPDAAVRTRLVRALSVLRDPRAGARLEQMAASDPDSRVRRAAKRALLDEP